MIVAGGLNFGGPGTLPQGRTDTSYVFTDTLSRASGRHSIKLGGEYRHFLNENFAEGTGVFNFPSVAAFLAGTANAFNITLGERRSRHRPACRCRSSFRTSVTIRDNLTLELGLRYEWHVTPTERDDQFVVFDAAQRVAAARRRRPSTRSIEQNNRNVEPRLGVAWDARVRRPHRGARARMGTPWTSRARRRSGTPPAIRRSRAPLTATGVDSPRAARSTRRSPLGLAPVDRRSRGSATPRCESWNVNVQRQLARQTGRDGGLLRLPRHEPADLAQHQPAGERRPPVPARVAVEPDPSRHAARQHHAGGEQRLFELPRRVGLGHQAAVARTAVRCVVHLVEVARHQFAQFVRLRRPGRLRHPEPVRPVGLRRPPSVRAQRDLRACRSPGTR